jgi:hypothetical protein
MDIQTQIKENEKPNENLFIPYERSEEYFPTLKLKKKNLERFEYIISNIEETIKNAKKLQMSEKKKTEQKKETETKKEAESKSKSKIAIFDDDKDINVGISYEERLKIKIKGMKGEKLMNHINNLIIKLNEFTIIINNEIDMIDTDYKNFINEISNKKLASKLIDVRRKLQPNCESTTYKTSGFFSSAFGKKLTSTNASDVNIKIYTDLEKCFQYLLEIIMEYCYKSGFFGNKDFKSEQNKFNTTILFQQRGSQKEAINAIIVASHATKEYLKDEGKEETKRIPSSYTSVGGYKKNTQKNISYSTKLNKKTLKH